MNIPARSLVLLSLVLASCGGVTASRTASPTITTATATSTASAPGSSVVSPPAFATSECTNATATTRQVIERYMALSTSNDAQAVTDCFAKVWRDKNASLPDAAALWSHSGPATNVLITFGDTVNGCDRFGVSAQMANSAFRVPPFFSVGPDAGRMRIYETSTGLANASLTTLRCP